MKKKLVSILLVFTLALSCLAPAALATDGGDEFYYLALGDSITAGIGLPDSTLDVDETGLYVVRPNFTGYPGDCYVALVAEGLGLDREHALNVGLPGAESPTLLELVQTGNAVTRMPYSLPELEGYIREADVISISIGLNDASTHMFDLLYETCASNLYPLMTYVTDGTLANPSPENMFKILRATLEVDMSISEFTTLVRTLLNGMQQVCDEGLAAIQTNLPPTIDRIRELNPDARILLIGYYNGLPVSRVWTRFTKNLNAYAEALAAEKGVEFVPIPRTRISADAHPTASGHAYIARQILAVLDSYPADTELPAIEVPAEAQTAAEATNGVEEAVAAEMPEAVNGVEDTSGSEAPENADSAEEAAAPEAPEAINGVDEAAVAE